MQRVFILAGNTAWLLVLTVLAIRNRTARMLLRGFARWHVSRITKEHAAWNRPERFTVIIDSFKRPWNIQPLIETFFRCDFVDRIIISNNNPDIRIREHVRIRDERLTLIDQPERTWSGIRFSIAASVPGRHFIAVDDDLFLRPSQLRTLAEALVCMPEVPHGMFGTLVVSKNGEPSLKRGQYGFTNTIDVVQRAYFFSKTHAERFQEIQDRARREHLAPEEDIRISDDIMLSVCGAGKPLCHDVGPFWDCFSARLKNIALYKSVDHFPERRMRFLLKLQALRGVR